jgi:type IX secretion system substrate protein
MKKISFSLMLLVLVTLLLALDPPTNPSAVLQDYNDVLVSWEPPGGAPEWIQWDDGTNGNSLGLQGGTAPYTFSSASKWDPAQLTAYDGFAIVKIKFFPNDPADFTLKIWSGPDAGTVEYEQVIVDYTVGEFNEIILDTPHIIDASTHLWFGYDVSHDEEMHPAGTDDGPAIEGYGDMCYFNGVWQPLTPLGFAYNFNLAALLEGSDGLALTSKRMSKSEKVRHDFTNIARQSANSSLSLSCEISRATHRRYVEAVTDASRALLGYKIFRNGAIIADISDPTTFEHLDVALDAGVYEYEIVAVYDEGDSDPAPVVTATVLLPAPANAAASIQGANVFVTWSSPTETRDIDSYNVYRDGILYSEEVSSTFFIDIDATSGETYIYNITTLYDGGWESEYSNDAEITITGAGGELIPLVTELEGNFPNPFNPTTTIKFGLNESATVTLEVYNIRGEKVRTLVDSELEAKYHTVLWNGEDSSGKNVSSGVYFYKMKAGEYSSTKKMIMMK